MGRSSSTAGGEIGAFGFYWRDDFDPGGHHLVTDASLILVSALVLSLVCAVSLVWLQIFDHEVKVIMDSIRVNQSENWPYGLSLPTTD
jgi:hypothetical protein